MRSDGKRFLQKFLALRIRPPRLKPGHRDIGTRALRIELQRSLCGVHDIGARSREVPLFDCIAPNISTSAGEQFPPNGKIGCAFHDAF